MLNINLQKQLGELSLTAHLAIPAKGVTAIFGRSGAGKSSLINLVAGLSTPDEGEISLNGKTLFHREKGINLPPEKRNIGYVFQEHRLFPHYSVEKNLKYGCKRFDFIQFSQIIRLLGIEHLLNRYPSNLSGGEKQRVAIGRALLSNPDILLMDEPLSALDLPRKQELMNYLAELARQVDIPILYVSHSLEEIVRLADHLILIDQGKIVAFDRVVNVWHSPVFSAWQPDSQKLTLLELPIDAYQPVYKMLGLSLGHQQIWIGETPHYAFGEKRRVTIASRDVSISLDKAEYSSIRNVLYGTITRIIELPDRIDLSIFVDAHEIWATITLWSYDELALKIGQDVYIQIKSVSL